MKRYRLNKKKLVKSLLGLAFVMGFSLVMVYGLINGVESEKNVQAVQSENFLKSLK